MKIDCVRLKYSTWSVNEYIDCVWPSVNEEEEEEEEEERQNKGLTCPFREFRIRKIIREGDFL